MRYSCHNNVLNKSKLVIICLLKNEGREVISDGLTNEGREVISDGLSVSGPPVGETNLKCLIKLIITSIAVY